MSLILGSLVSGLVPLLFSRNVCFQLPIQDYGFVGLKPLFLIGVENGCWFHYVYFGESTLCYGSWWLCVFLVTDMKSCFDCTNIKKTLKTNKQD